MKPAASAASSCIPPIPTSSTSARLGRTTGPQQERGVYQDHRRRPELDARPVRRPEHRLLRPEHRRQRSEHALRRHVAGGDAHLRHVQRRPVERASMSRTMAARTGRSIEGHGLPKSPVGKIDVAPAPSEFQARLRADSDRRPGLHLALRRWRRKLDQRKLAARADRPRRLLHQARGESQEPRRSVRRQQQLLAFDRRRQERSPPSDGAATRTISGSTPPTPTAS